MLENKCYRILVVEDSLLNQQIIREILQDTYRVEKAITAEEALEKVRSFQPHLILLDILLPDANGFDVLTTLKKDEKSRNIPVIIITGLDSEEDEEKGFLLGAVDYIKKPYKNAIVRARVNTQIHIIRQMHTIERLGLIDVLTGAFNRRAFDNQIHYEWVRSIRERREISMIMLDIDYFKRYNDTYGHSQGDVMLRSGVKALVSAMGSTDFVFRYGGDEFAVLLPGDGLRAALATAESLRASVEKTEVPCHRTHSVTKITVSLGISTVRPKAPEQLPDFIEQADRMLYRAKRGGRNQVQF
ncbi:MAG: diguanylate cyclase [Intestinimonas sp.]|nr:diguanylate cyclase [Intestinimonas sp.]